MSFQALMSGAECSTGNNALNSFLKHTQNDRSVQQGDRTTVGPGAAGPSMRNGLRTAPLPPGASQQDADRWFAQQTGQPGGLADAQAQSAFQFEAMRQEMERLGGAKTGAPGGASWANEMMRTGAGPGPGASNVLQQQFMRIQQQQQQAGGQADFEAAFQGAKPAPGSSWGNEFSNQSQAGPTTAGPAPASSRPMGYMGSMGGGMYAPMGMGMGMGMGGMSMGMGGMGMTSQLPPAGMTEGKGKGRFVELDDAQWEEQFKKLDEDGAKAASAHQKAADDAKVDKGKAKEEASNIPTDAEMERRVRAALDALERDVSLEGRSAEASFEELWNVMQSQQGGRNGIPPSAADADLQRFEEELTKQRQRAADDDDDAFEYGNFHPSGGLQAGGRSGLDETRGWDGTEDALLDGFGTVGADGFPRLGSYRFNQTNPFVQHANPLAEGLRLLSSGGSLADAALLFEVATQRNVEGGSGGEQGEVDRARREKSEAWRRLGEAQAMNEREVQAIRALEEAVKIDEGNLEAYMSLAISYINEGYDAAAHATLERYVTKAYPHIKAKPQDPSLDEAVKNLEGRDGVNPWAALNRVTDMFLQAAREGASRGAIDPEVQVGLGVLFYSNSSYDQAKDCFETALQARPNDFLLWNRLGATLANGGKPEEAIQAYHKALELRPTFTRAIYNLSVSCLNLGAHHEAAEHLLSALSLQQTHALPDVPPEISSGEPRAPPLAEAQESHNLWSTLRRIFLCMDRMDLAQKAHVGATLEQFRKEGFEF